jgi:hypothetical protein
LGAAEVEFFEERKTIGDKEQVGGMERSCNILGEKKSQLICGDGGFVGEVE